MRMLRVGCWLLCLGVLGWGCLGNNSIREGLPCRTDQDCKGPVAELFCNKDNLCEAQSCNSGDTRTCFTGAQGCDVATKKCEGGCKVGEQTCSNGVWGPCSGQVLPSPETCDGGSKACCDGVDNNCDGKIDETFPATKICEFSSGAGAGPLSICKAGKEVCDTDGRLVYIRSKDQDFQMGSPVEDKARDTDEGVNNKTVTVSFGYSYGIGRTEVTQKQFQEIMGYNPSPTKGDDLPVSNISWHEAAMYTVLLSKKEGLEACFDCTGSFDGSSKQPYTGTCKKAGKFAGESFYAVACPGYRLPTEAEWEYAYFAKAGGGPAQSFYNGKMEEPANKGDYKDAGLDLIAVYKKNKAAVQKVKGLKANAWELFDMSGNVAEWVFDLYQPSYDGANQDWIGPDTVNGPKLRGYRGGHFDAVPQQCRGANRDKLDPAQKEAWLGFRIARTLVIPK